MQARAGVVYGIANNTGSDRKCSLPTLNFQPTATIQRIYGGCEREDA
jgi:hypothetical protein